MEGVLRRLRDDEREATVATPPAAGVVVRDVQPPAVAATTRAEQVRTAVGILDGRVHAHDPPETHRLELLVAELLADEAGDLGMGVRELAALGGGADLLGDPIAIVPEGTDEHRDVVGDAVGRLEVL